MTSCARLISKESPLSLRFITTNGPDIGEDKDVRKQIRSQAAKRGKSKPIRSSGIRNRVTENKTSIETDFSQDIIAKNDPRRRLNHSRTKIRDTSGKQDRGSSIKGASGAVASSEKHQSCTNCPFCLQLRMLMNKSPLSLLGGELDPFLSLPATSNSQVSTARLLFHSRNIERPFKYRSWIGLVDITPPCYKKIAPAFLASSLKSDARLSSMYVDRLAILMSSLISGTHMDVLRGLREESLATMTAKTDIVSLVNELMADPLSQATDLTVMVITHLLCCEAVLGDKVRVGLHARGLAQVLSQRGNLRTMVGSGYRWNLAQCATSITFVVCLIYDIELPDFYFDYSALETSKYCFDSLTLLESPLFSPTDGYTHLSPSSLRSTNTFDILENMRQLTRNILEINEDTSRQQIKDHAMNDFSENVLQTVEALKSLPSATEPDSPVVNDWVYESVRLSALIYAVALSHRIPLPATISILEDPRTGMSGRQVTRTLNKICCRLQDPSRWNSMGGVLLWVALVGAAASQRDPAGRVFHEDADDEGFYDGGAEIIKPDIDMTWIAEDDVAYKQLNMIVMGYVGLISTEHAPALGRSLVQMMRIRSFLNGTRDFE